MSHLRARAASEKPASRIRQTSIPLSSHVAPTRHTLGLHDSLGNRGILNRIALQRSVPFSPSDDSAQPIQRKCAACVDEVPCLKCQEDQAIPLKYVSENVSDVRADSSSKIASLGGGGQPLSSAVRTFYESRLGIDFSDVRIHTGTDAATSASRHSARAFTTGSDIVFGAGEFSPTTVAGNRLLAHELTHVAQQRGGVYLEGGVGEVGDIYERQANAVADAVASGQSTSTLLSIANRDNNSKPPPTAGAIQRDPVNATGKTNSQLATPVRELNDLVQSQPPGFTDPELDAAYQRYLVSEASAADPRTWAFLQTTGRPRDRLVRLLGPDYARGQLTGSERPPVDVSAPTVPAGYDPTRQHQDLAALRAGSSTLTDRLSNLEFDPITSLSIGVGHQSILQGNVAEVLARPLLEQAQQGLRQTEPNAQLFLGVTAQLRMSDGSWTRPLLFTDGIIGVIEPAGLRVLRIAEVKSGAEGGVQGQEQVHRWIEAHSTVGLRILLPGVARAFEYSDTKREVLDLTRAPRMVIVPSDARFAGARSGHGTTAPVVRIRMAQSSVEIAYLTAVMAQRLLLESQARQIIKRIEQAQLRPQVVESTLALQEAATITRLQTQSQGLALVNGVLYRVGTGGNGRSIQRLPMQPLQLPQGSIGPGASSPTSGSPPATVVPQPRGLTTAPGPLQLFGVPGSAEVAPGVRIPTNVINFSDQPIGVDRRVVAPSEPVELRAGNIVVRGESASWRAMDARTGRPIAAVFEGGQFYTVAATGRVVSIGEDGRVSVNTAPELVPLTSAPVAGGATAGRPASPAMRGVAAGLGIFAVVNEILGPIGRNLQQQRRNIAMGRAQIDFWVQFGGNPHHRVWVIGDRAAAGPGTEADTAVFGSGSYPYVTSIDVASFARTLPGLITSYRDFLLFLDMAKVLGTIQEDPTMPAFPSAQERRTPRRYFARVNAPDRDRRLWHDITDIIAPLGERLLGTLDTGMRQSLAAMPQADRAQIFRLRQGSETSLYRSARGGQPILSDQQLLGNDPWVRSLGREQSGGIGGWFWHGQYRDRMLVAPANADAQRAAIVSTYVVKKTPDEVLDEVREGNRPILSRSPPEGEGDVVSFVAGPEPGNSRFGETRYYRHPNWPDVRWTAAIGELHQFWVDSRDLEPVALQDVNAYVNEATSAARGR